MKEITPIMRRHRDGERNRHGNRHFGGMSTDGLLQMLTRLFNSRFASGTAIFAQIHLDQTDESEYIDEEQNSSRQLMRREAVGQNPFNQE